MGWTLLGGSGYEMFPDEAGAPPQTARSNGSRGSQATTAVSHSRASLRPARSDRAKAGPSAGPVRKKKWGKGGARRRGGAPPPSKPRGRAPPSPSPEPPASLLDELHGSSYVPFLSSRVSSCFQVAHGRMVVQLQLLEVGAASSLLASRGRGRSTTPVTSPIRALGQP
jgi:hypothetical protein